MIDEHPQDEHLRAKAQCVADAFARAYNRKHKIQIPVPVPMRFDLEYDLILKQPKSAGMAIRGSFEVVLNMTLYRDNVKETLNETIPHEVAHLGQFCYEKKQGLVRGSASHGPLWQSLMSSMSKKPTKLHAMDTTKAVAAHKAHKAQMKKPKDDES